MITDKNKEFLARFDHHLEDEHVDAIVNDEWWDVRQSIVSHPKLKDHQIEKLVNDPVEEVRESIAFNNKIDFKPHQIDKLVNDKDWLVRANIASHPNLKVHHIEKLLGDSYHSVVYYAKTHPLYQELNKGQQK